MVHNCGIHSLFTALEALRIYKKISTQLFTKNIQNWTYATLNWTRHKWWPKFLHLPNRAPVHPKDVLQNFKLFTMVIPKPWLVRVHYVPLVWMRDEYSWKIHKVLACLRINLMTRHGTFLLVLSFPFHRRNLVIRVMS